MGKRKSEFKNYGSSFAPGDGAAQIADKASRDVGRHDHPRFQRDYGKQKEAEHCAAHKAAHHQAVSAGTEKGRGIFSRCFM